MNLAKLFRNEPAYLALGMRNDLRNQIIAEIKLVEAELDQRKRLIKNNVAETLGHRLSRK